MIVEVQLQPDPAKRWSWPQYVTALRARLECPVVLLVIAPERSVARWAREPIETGHPGYGLSPIVVEMADVPRIDDLAVARQRPELAVLSVLAHPELEVARAALAAISTLPGDRAGLYFDLILDVLPVELGNRIGANVLKNYEFRSAFMREQLAKAVAEARAELLREGRDEGLREGRDEGLREGKCVGLRVALLGAVRIRVAAPVPELEARIAKLTSVDVLEDLIEAVVRAATEEAAIAALDRLAPSFVP
ncbi:MAG: hypothetical protein ABI467_12380 [Kofleriaceae bacterium]